MQVQLPHRHGNHHMPSDMTCHVSFHQESAGNLEAVSGAARRVSQISLMFIVARKWMQLCAIIGWWVPEHSPATRLKNTPTRKIHVCTHAHDCWLSNADVSGCAAVTIRTGSVPERHEDRFPRATTLFLFPPSQVWTYSMWAMNLHLNM